MGSAFLVDASTFAASAICLMLIRTRRAPDRDRETTVLTEIREGFAFVRSQPWLWATLMAASVSLLAFWGPQEVLLPFLIKNQLGGSASDFGFVLAAAGAGAIVSALTMSQRGLPRRHVLFMYLAWATAMGSITIYGFATHVWMLAAASAVEGLSVAAGMVVWATLMHRLVPTHLLGRVSSLDWFVSIALVPVSYAITGPIAAAAGVRTTLIGAGVLGCVLTLSFLLVPRIRGPESDPRMTEPERAARARVGVS